MWSARGAYVCPRQRAADHQTQLWEVKRYAQGPGLAAGRLAGDVDSKQQLLAGKSDESVERQCERVMQLAKASYSASCAPPRTSIYGAALVLPQVASEFDWHPLYFGKVVQAFSVLIVTYFVQFLFIYEVFRINASHAEACDHDEGACAADGFVLTSGWPRWRLCHAGTDAAGIRHQRFLCVLMFIVALFADFRETLDMLTFVLQSPVWAEPWLRLKLNGQKYTTKGLQVLEDTGELCCQAAGMKPVWKVVNVVCLVVPKMLIFLLLLLAGITFILNEKDRAELIINAGALIFVVQVDKLMFHTGLPRDIQELLLGLEARCPDAGGGDPATSDDGSSEDENLMVRGQRLGLYLWFALRGGVFASLILCASFLSLQWYLDPCGMPSGDGVDHDMDRERAALGLGGL